MIFEFIFPDSVEPLDPECCAIQPLFYNHYWGSKLNTTATSMYVAVKIHPLSIFCTPLEFGHGSALVHTYQQMIITYSVGMSWN